MTGACGNLCPAPVASLPRATGMMTSRLLKVCIFIAASWAGLVQGSAQEWTGQLSTPSAQCVLRTGDSQADYQSWIRDYRSGPLPGNLLDHHQIQLAVTVLDGDDLQPATNYPFSCGVTTSISIGSNGTISWSRRTPDAFQGGGPSTLSAKDLRILQPLLAKLSAHPPEDDSRLPPPGRRVVLQVSRKREVVARVYDRADIPESVLEILGLAGATQGPLTMRFAPDLVTTRDDFDARGIPPQTLGLRTPHPADPITKGLRADTVTLAVSLDRTLVVTRYLPFDGRVVVTDAKKSAVVHEEADGILKDRRWIYVSHAWFTPDGKFLLLLTNLPEMRIYDTETWQRVDALPELPAAAVAYYPSRDWKRGLAVSPAGAVELWDAPTRGKVATLDLDGNLDSVSFSPDDSLFAVTSVRQNKDQSSTFHLRIWQTSTGKFLREMRPLYYFAHDGTGVPQWWGDGKYLMAETREGRFGGYVVGIWNTDSGKLRGGLSGCADSINDPFAVSLVGQILYDWCPDGKLLTWNAADAIAKIGEFENSLKPPPALAIRH